MTSVDPIVSDVLNGQASSLFPTGDSNQLLGTERVALIDPEAIRHNVKRIKEVTSGALLMAAVKTGGYGHGAVTAATAALEAGADWLGLAHITEALELRNAGIQAPMLAWLHTTQSDFGQAIQSRIAIGISNWDLHFVARAAAQTGMQAEVHLKVDTGLGRHGASLTEFPDTARAAAEYQRQGLIRVTGIFTHLAVADEPHRYENARQLDRFESAIRMAREAGLNNLLRHVVSTAGAFSLPEAHYDMVRVGAGLFGLTPFVTKTAEALGLRPAMEVRTSVANIKTIGAGEGVSYGLLWVADKPTKVALIPVGYSDGIPRISHNAPVRIGNTIYRSVGRVAMDQFLVNLGSLDEKVSIGDTVTVFGGESGISADEFAASAQTIGCELVTKIGARVPRIVADGGYSPESSAYREFESDDVAVERDGAYVDIINTAAIPTVPQPQRHKQKGTNERHRT